MPLRDSGQQTSPVIQDHNVISPKFIANIGGDHGTWPNALNYFRSNQYRRADFCPTLNTRVWMVKACAHSMDPFKAFEFEIF